MKKTISVLLVIALILSIVIAIIPATAATPSGTAINSASDFTSMKGNGKYYLAKDITINANGSDVAMMKNFSGTFDGNGHTITMNGFSALFWRVMSAGVVKNLTVKGTVNLTSSKIAAGVTFYNDGTLENVISDVDFISSGYAYQESAHSIGGICAQVDTASANPKFINCQFTGSIDINTTDRETDRPVDVGGILGKAYNVASLTLTGCVNKGNITSVQRATQIGGIVGYLDHISATITGCVNEGTLATAGTKGGHLGFGGIIGCAYNSGNAGAKLIIKNCEHAGKMSLTVAGSNTHTGGMIGRAYAMPYIEIEGCMNSGDITVLEQRDWSSAGGMIGSIMTVAAGDKMHWSNLTAATYTIKNCENTGKIYGLDAGGMIGAGMQLCAEAISITVENCLNAGVIYSNSNAGGIMGVTALYSTGYGPSFGNMKFTNCYNAGFIKGMNMSAGIVGYVSNPNTNAAQVTEFNNCINTAEIGNGYLGEVYNKISASGIVGQIDRPVTVKNCVNMGKVNGSTINSKGLAPIVFANGKTVTASGNACVDDYGIAETYATKKTVDEIVAGVTSSGIALSDKSLMDAYDAVRVLKGEDYTADSWVELVKACQGTFVLYEKVGVITKKEVEDAAKSINRAIANLVDYPVAE